MKYVRRILYVLLPVVLIGVIWTQRYNLHDWWQLRNYTPPTNISQLAKETTMTDYGQRLFYVNRPQLDDKTSFNQNCTVTEQSIVLGCYVSGRGIYVFDVTDERLAGVHEVTAAHEMLHAAYERLGKADRERIDKLTEQVYSSITDQRLKETIEAYRSRDPSVVPNELHSILGTEVKDLPPELETYYKRYFADRQAIVTFSAQYESAFEERKNKVAEYDARLAALKKQIESSTASLEASAARITSDRQKLNTLLANKQYSEYNAMVPGFNQQVRSYNALVSQVRAQIDTYNNLVAERNSVALEENELIKAIDSRPTAIPTQ